MSSSIEQRVKSLEEQLEKLMGQINRNYKNAAAETEKKDEITKEKLYGAWRLIKVIALEARFEQADLIKLENVIFSDELSADEIAEQAKDITEGMA